MRWSEHQSTRDCGISCMDGNKSMRWALSRFILRRHQSWIWCPVPPHISLSPAVVGQPKLFHQHQVPEELLLRFIIREICLSICGYEYVANIETHYVDHMIDRSSVSGYKNPKPMHQMAGLLDHLPRLSYLLNFPRGPSQLSMAHNSHPNT